MIETPPHQFGDFRLGCAIWAYKGWLGELYPPSARPGEFLRLYGDRFTTVEGNTTFYSVPDGKTLQRWATETPAGFEFCPKLPKTVTHAGALQPQIAPAQRFVEHLRTGLGDRLGPIFAQLPPGYPPTQLADLRAFLAALAQLDHDIAVEVRHPDWFRPPHAARLRDCLRTLGLGRVLLDSRPMYDFPDDPQLDSERRKPQVPLQPELTAPFTLVRYISHPNLRFNQTYLDAWTPQVGQWLRQGNRVYFFVHCPVEARSPANARHFQHLLEQQGYPVPPLPWDHLPQPAAQLSLF